MDRRFCSIKNHLSGQDGVVYSPLNNLKARQRRVASERRPPMALTLKWHRGQMDKDVLGGVPDGRGVRIPMALITPKLTRPLLPMVREHDFLLLVLDTLKIYGWKFYHTKNSRGSHKGFPDICAVRGDRVIFAELKRMRGKLTIQQRHWLKVLGESGKVEAYAWWPEQWTAILEILK